MTTLSDKAGFLIAANLVKYAVGFLLPMALVRMMSKDDYGTYQQLILVSNAAAVLGLGIPTSVYYFYHHVPAERRAALIAQTLLMLGATGTLATLIVLLAAGRIVETFHNPAMGGPLRLYALALVFTIASEHAIGFLIVQNRYRSAVALEVGETAVRVTMLLVPLWLGYGLYGVIVGIVLFAALRFVIRSFWVLNSPGVDFSGWRHSLFPLQQLGYCAPLALSGVSWMIGMAFNKGIVAASFTPAQYAIYAVGALEIPLDVIFQISVHNILRASLPPLVRDGNMAEVVRIIREAVRKLAIVVLPSFVFLFDHADTFITALFTTQYRESVEIFRIYVLVVPLHMLVLSPIPQVFGKTRIHLYINLVVIATLLLLSYVLLKTFGFYGPAMAWVAAQYVGVLLFLVVIRRLVGAGVLRLLPLRDLARIAAVAIVATLAARLAGDAGWPPVGNLLAAAATFSVVFLVLAPLTGVFTAQDRRLIRRWMAKVLPVRAE